MNLPDDDARELVSRTPGLPTGLRMKLPSDALAAVLQTVDAERQCCRFLRFAITVEPDGGPIWVDVSGPPGTREFLSALLER